MGVKGLTTYVNQKQMYIEYTFQPNSKVVIDGDCLASNMFFQMNPRNTCFGGDYNTYAHVIEKFFKMLSDCKINPYVLFDGGNNEKKNRVLQSVLKNRVHSSLNIHHPKKGTLPLCLGEVCKGIVKKMKIPMVVCDFDCHQEVACLAKHFDCPVLSQESDYFIFDVKYVPFFCDETSGTPNLNSLTIKRNNDGENILRCKMFDRNGFLLFTNITKDMLPVLSIILGNDFIVRTKNIANLYSIFNITEQANKHQFVDQIIKWLGGKSCTAVLEKLLQNVCVQQRTAKQEKCIEVLNWFKCKESKFAKYFVTQSINDIEGTLFNLPDDFLKKYRNNLYYHNILNMILYDRYFPKIQIEDVNKLNSHTNSFHIVSVIYKIIKNDIVSTLTFYGRFGNKIGKKIIERCVKEVPSLEQLQILNYNTRVYIFLDILDIGESFQNTITLFPKSWQIFLVAIKYFTLVTKIESSIIYALLLSKIMLTVIKKRNTDNTTDLVTLSGPVADVIKKLNESDCAFALKHLNPHCTISNSLVKDFKLYDICLVHSMSEFQSCLFHINMLNGVFNKPFEDCYIWESYNGTFIYNIVTSMRNTNIDFIYCLLQKSPTVSNLFSTIVEIIKKEICCINLNPF